MALKIVDMCRYVKSVGEGDDSIEGIFGPFCSC